MSEPNTAIFAENSEEKLGIGSGIIVSPNGYILANQSIVGRHGSNVYVTLKNGSKYVAETVWQDEVMDIAIIKIAANNLITLGFGDSDSITLGEKIYMISNPNGYNFNQRIQEGIISEKNKTFKILDENNQNSYVEDITKLSFDIDASENGSPVLNENGELLGIASSKLNSVIPINRVKNIIQKLEQDGSFEESYLGINGFDYDVAKFLNNAKIDSGIYIDQISDNSPAIETLKVGDIICLADDKELLKMQDLTEYLYTKNPGDTLKLNVLRGTEKLEIEITLKKK